MKNKDMIQICRFESGNKVLGARLQQGTILNAFYLKNKEKACTNTKDSKTIIWWMEDMAKYDLDKFKELSLELDQTSEFYQPTLEILQKWIKRWEEKAQQKRQEITNLQKELEEYEKKIAFLSNKLLSM